MNDFTFVVIMVAFFALSALFVAGCDRIIGSDEQQFAGSTEAEATPPPRERDAA